MTVVPIQNNTPSSTTTAIPPNELAEWIFEGTLILVGILASMVIFLLLLYSCLLCRRCRVRKDYTNIPGAQFERGLRNLGNTCYFNSAIQGLASTPILKSEVTQTVDKGGPLTSEFVKFIEPIQPAYIKVPRSLDPRPLHAVFCAKVPRFDDSQEHDSHEFLHCFLDQLRQEEKRVSENLCKTPTVVDRIFGGHFMTVYICKECNSPYHICEPCLDISVPVCCGGDLSSSDTSEEENTENTKAVIDPSPYQEAVQSIMETLSAGKPDLPEEIRTLDDCLQYFTRRESLGRQYLCKRCANDPSSSIPYRVGDSRLTSATKRTLIFDPPAILVMHLKRFELKSPGFEKRTDKIEFRELLDIAPYCSSWCLRNEARQKNIWYSLYAVVVHSGTLSHGHYVAYVKERSENKDVEKFLQETYFDRGVTAEQLVETMKVMSLVETPKVSTKGVAKEGTWYCVNDSKVSRVALEEVLSREAFLLFYERISPI